MTKETGLYRVTTQTGIMTTPSHVITHQYTRVEEAVNPLPQILFITSFPPRECGIATYSQDLINALNNQFENSFDTVICALESDSEQHSYVQHPAFILNTENRNSFSKLAFQINKDHNIKVIVVQHEFGFFHKKENEFKSFIEELTKPIVFVFHTVLPMPNAGMRAKMQHMCDNAHSIIVMTKDAATILREEYKIDENKISIIPHGTHLISPPDRSKLKEEHQLTGKKVLSTFGLLGCSKSIETTLNALPAIVAQHPNVVFLVLGKTHPALLKEEGEKYRTMLENKVRELHIEEHVRFVNAYLELPVLLAYLQLSDIYLFTSKDPNQAVSGTFSYAVSCGCPVISTPIPHAKEVLSNNNGILIDFENSEQLAAAVISLLDNEDLRNEISSNSFHKMAPTSWQNSAVAHALHFKQISPDSIILHYRSPKINLNHIRRMTTDVGLIQFSKIACPDIHSGYTLDDNARALIAICQHFVLTGEIEDLPLIDTYLKFIKYCLQDHGKFLNYANARLEFTPQNAEENLEDSNGRAMWALGFVISLCDKLPGQFIEEANDTFQQALTHMDKIHSTRAMAFIIKGLHFRGHAEDVSLIELFANRLVQMYSHENTHYWHWFETYLTYGNSLLPEALLCAYKSTGQEIYRHIAKESFTFLLSKIFMQGKIHVISNKGWHVKDRIDVTVVGGEQPIDVAYTILTLERFYNEFKEEDYKQKALSAFHWFLGENHLHQIVYNPCTGGCYDGIEEHDINLNQGAESTLSYLLARLAMERLTSIEQKTKPKNNRTWSTQTKRRHTKKIVQFEKVYHADKRMN